MPQTFDEIHAWARERVAALNDGDPGDHQQGHAALEALLGVLDWAKERLPDEQLIVLSDIVNKAWRIE